MSTVGGILLAAGEASRFGAPKQAADLGGETLLQRTVGYLARVNFSARVVVLGAHVERVKALLPDEMPRVINPDWPAGMLGSLQTGLRFLLEREAELAAVFVMAGDQPDFATAQIERYLRAARSEEGWCPVLTDYPKGYGLPFVLPRVFFDAILALPPDARLRPLLQQLPYSVTLGTGPHLRDIDTPGDLKNWLDKQG